MTASIWIKKIIFNDDTTLELGKNDIVLFVGPNNAGKSVALRRLYELFADQGNSVLPIAKSIEVQRDGTEEELIRWLENNCQETRREGDNYVVSKGPHGYWVSDLKHLWNAVSPRPNALGAYFSSWGSWQQTRSRKFSQYRKDKSGGVYTPDSLFICKCRS
jgi:hypothetical protein